MLDTLFFVNLVLNATELFKFLAPQLGVRIGDISTVLLLFNVFYLIAKLPYTTLAFHRMSIWLVLLVIWPLASVGYAPTIDFRSIGLTVYCFTLLYSTVVYTMVNGLPSLHRMLTVSLTITTLGMLLSMIVPGYFESVAKLADTQHEYLGRAYGFFLQPNRCGTSLCLLFIGWFAMWKRDTIVQEPIAVFTFLLLLFLTGSRTAALMGGVIVVLHLVHQWRVGFASSRSVRHSSWRYVVLGTCVLVGIVGARSCIQGVGHHAERRYGDLVARVEALLDFRLSLDGSIEDDRSLNERLAAQKVYWTMIAERPILGYGMGAESYLVENGLIHKSSHSALLTVVLEYGWIYSIAFVVLMLSLWRHRYRKAIEAALGTNSIVQFSCTLLVIFVINGGILDTRILYVVWGMFITMCLLWEYKTTQGEGMANILRSGFSTSALPTAARGKIARLQTQRRRPVTTPLFG